MLNCTACCGVDANNLDVIGAPTAKMPGLGVNTQEAAAPAPPAAAATVSEAAAVKAPEPAPVPAAAPAPAPAPPTNEMEIVVEKKDQELGLDVDFANEKTLVVVKVKPGGLLESWNKANPDKALMENDQIVAINGATGSTKAMLEKVQQGGTLTIKVERKKN
eukprot:TRINITY_DN15856_c0_g1_i1.p1 TRINITY_DN15856_c0_g1~~TRINITY_DN15856_c0_g1_i1.p1  ORF type:complete len:162 (-),score=53.99 TRINITY_DN15856_c0_g1_i1:231-716(-)